MLTSPSLSSLSPSREELYNPQRLARHTILNGLPIPPTVAAHLEALGINVGDFENRVRMSFEDIR